MAEVEPRCERAFSPRIGVGNPPRFPESPAVACLETQENSALSLAPDFYHGLLELHLLASGHRVRTAATAEEALRGAERHSFDIAFVDIRLGSGSGLEILPRRRRASPHGRLVVMTAYASIETAVEALR